MSAAQPDADGIGLSPDPVYGAVIANFPSDRARLLLIAGGVSASSAVILNFTTAAIPGWIGPALTIVLMAAIVLVTAWYALHLWNREVILYERGFSLREGSHIVFFRYDEVSAVRLRAERLAYFGGLIRRSVYATTIITVREETFTLDNAYRRAAQFGGLLLTKVAPIIRARMDEALNRGEAFSFRGLTLTPEGIRIDDDVLPWAEAGNARIGGGMLTLRRVDETIWRSVPLKALDNLPILLDALRARAASQPGADAQGAPERR